MIPSVWIGLIVNGLFAALAFWAGSITGSGALGGILLGTWIYAFLGLRGFAVMAGFFILASFFTRWGYGVKAKRGIAQKKGGRRTYREAFANCLTGAIFATLSFFTGHFLYPIGFVAAFATALADTTATELGPLYGRKTFLVPSFRKVPPGTKGAVSFEGTLLGILAAGALVCFGAALSLIQRQDILYVLSGATAGFLGESVLAALPWAGHQIRNFLNTVLGGILAMALVWFL